MKRLQWLIEEQGVSSMEYAIIAALISLAIIAAVTGIGGQLASIFMDTGSKIPK